jgi:hypothetical protein
MLTLENAFTQTEIAAAINVIPNNYGRLNQLNLMPIAGVLGSEIAIEEANGTLGLLPTTTMNGGVVGGENKRRIRTFHVPKITYDEHVNPADVDRVRAFGGNLRANLATLLNQRLGAARSKHDITLEHLRMGALKGEIRDADGSTVLYNLYTEFGITAKTVDFVLGTAGTEVREKCMEVVRHIEDNLLGDGMTNVHALVSPEFFDKLVRHATVKAAFANYQEASQRLGGDLRRGFTFGGITFEEYRAQAAGTGGNVRFIAAGDGHAFPLGTSSTFGTFVAPADFNEAVNTLGQQYYGKVVPAKFDRGYDVHTQQNPLPMCMRPGVLVRLFSSN